MLNESKHTDVAGDEKTLVSKDQRMDSVGEMMSPSCGSTGLYGSSVGDIGYSHSPMDPMIPIREPQEDILSPILESPTPISTRQTDPISVSRFVSSFNLGIRYWDLNNPKTALAEVWMTLI